MWQNVPAGKDIPLVLQVGKWRRQIVLPSVAACTDTVLGDPALARLPRNKSEGDIPKIALTTGGADPLQCLLRKIGVDDAEFTNEDWPGRINLFAGNNGSAKFTDALQRGRAFPRRHDPLGSVDTLKKYDVVLLACEGGDFHDNKSAEARQAAMFDYTSACGGSSPPTHNYWLEAGPDPFPQTAVWNHTNHLVDPFTALIDTSFPKGRALSDWLANVDVGSAPGQLVMTPGSTPSTP